MKKYMMLAALLAAGEAQACDFFRCRPKCQRPVIVRQQAPCAQQAVPVAYSSPVQASAPASLPVQSCPNGKCPNPQPVRFFQGGFR